jgi:hypothetical protein
MFLSYDIRGFAQSLKRNALGAFHEALIRHFISEFLGTLQGVRRCILWTALFRSLLKRQRFLLIVLDDARYDAFERVYGRYLHGLLIRARVPPPNTYGWLPRAFSYPEFDDVRVFYASIGTDKFYLSLFGMVSGRDARHRCGAGLIHQALQTSQVLSFRETLFCDSVHCRIESKGSLREAMSHRCIQGICENMGIQVLIFVQTIKES